MSGRVATRKVVRLRTERALACAASVLRLGTATKEQVAEVVAEYLRYEHFLALDRGAKLVTTRRQELEVSKIGAESAGRANVASHRQSDIETCRALAKELRRMARER